MKNFVKIVEIYRSFWKILLDRFCLHLGGIGAYLFTVLLVVFFGAIVLFFSFIHYLLSEANGAITNLAVFIGSLHVVLTADMLFRAFFFWLKRMRVFFDRLKGL